ncbi:MAG: nucleotidyltransferase family protein [Candidatus Freyarchaeota archaeon]
MVKNREEILALLRKELPNLKSRFGVRSIGLFGSYARGEQTEESDVNLLVEFERSIGFFRFIELEDHLSELLGVKVELVTPDALKPLIKTHVTKEVIHA